MDCQPAGTLELCSFTSRLIYITIAIIDRKGEDNNVRDIVIDA